MRRWLALLLVTLIPATSCSSEGEDAADQGETHTVQHALGETEIPVAPERVVTLWASTLSATIALDKEPVGYAFNEEPIEGVDVPEDYDIGQLDYLGDSQELDFERIAAANPHVILATEVHEDSYEQLSEIAPTVVLEWAGSGAWKSHLADVAEVLDAEDKADEVIDDYDERAAEVADAIGDPGDIEVSVVRFHAEELRLEVRNSFTGQVVDDVGLARPEVQDVEEEDSGYLPISLERLPDADGDAMFAFTIADTDTEQPDLLEQARENPLWDELDVVSDGEVYPVDYKTWISTNPIGAHAVLNDIEEALG